MKIFGCLAKTTEELLLHLQRETQDLEVRRRRPPRSDTPVPTSEDLEQSLIATFERHRLVHHPAIRHPRPEVMEEFEYDFFRDDLGLAIEIMGYRADDEVYKDVLKFHVHEGTRTGVVWVPAVKVVSGTEDDTNLRATLKALAFADSFMSVEALVAIPYWWRRVQDSDAWLLSYRHPE